MAEKATKRRITTPEDIEALVETDKAGIDIEQFDRGELKTILDRQLELVKRGVAPEAALRQAAGAVMKQNQTPKRRMTSLEQIELRTLNVTIYREGEDEAWEFELRELPRAKYFELARLIPDPTPPKKRDDPIDIMRVNGVIQRLYEIDELEYLQAQQGATNRRTMLRLLHCLVDFDVPGETENEKLDAMEAALPLDVVTGLIDAMNSFAEGSEARIEERAKSFAMGEISLLSMLDRKGWSIERWDSLKSDEQETWLAYERARRNHLTTLKDSLFYVEGGKRYTKSVDALARLLTKLF